MPPRPSASRPFQAETRSGRRARAASAWPHGDSETARLVRAVDWAATPLGRCEDWSASWRAAVDLALASPVAMCLEWGADGTVLYNDAYAALAPSVHPEAFGRTVGEVWPQFEAFSRANRSAVLRGEALSFRDRRVTIDHGQGPEPLWLDLDYSPVRDERGTPIAVLLIVHDTTERARINDALRALNGSLERRVAESVAQRQLWADIFENTDDPVAAVGPDLRLLAANKAYRDELRRLFDGAEVDVGVSLPEALAHMPGVRETSLGAWRAALAGRTVEALGVGRPDGDGPFYDLRFRPLHNREGERIGAFQYSRDVTPRVLAERRLHEAEEQLRQSQKMEAVGQLTGGIAHDFNNLLQGILGSLNLVQKRLESGRTAEVARFIAGAETSANRAAALTHRLLAFSRRQPLDPKPVKPNALVASMEDLLRRTLGEHVALELVLAGGLWQTLCDSNQLESALLNLAINARDAMPDGGRLTIETCNAHLDSRYAAKAGDVAPGQYVCIAVTDTGTGMPSDVLARAFDPFFTTKPIGKGTGLGLSMIYGFARQSEGYAKLYSEEGRGTTVKLYLPRRRGESEAAEAEGAAQQLTDAHLAEPGETVLVVEDEPVVRGLITAVLDELGYRALEASDGPSGLQLLRDRRRRIDLLVTDIGLPGLNGRQLADAARELRPSLKVLFMTGYAENAALASGFLDPGMAMMTKPFAMDHMASRIREMIEAG